MLLEIRFWQLWLKLKLILNKFIKFARTISAGWLKNMTIKKSLHILWPVHFVTTPVLWLDIETVIYPDHMSSASTLASRGARERTYEYVQTDTLKSNLQAANFLFDVVFDIRNRSHILSWPLGCNFSVICV